MFVDVNRSEVVLRGLVGVEARETFVGAPTEIRVASRPCGCTGKADLFPFVLADVGHPEVHLVVEFETPRIAQTHRPNAHHGGFGVARKRVDADDLAEHRRSVECDALGIVARPTVAGADVETSTGSECKTTSIVVRIGLVEGEENGTRRGVGGVVGAHAIARNHGVAVVIGVVDVEEAAVRMEHESEQPSFTRGPGASCEVECGRLCLRLGVEAHDPAVLFGDVETGVGGARGDVGGLGHGRDLGEPCRRVDDRGGVSWCGDADDERGDEKKRRARPTHRG